MPTILHLGLGAFHRAHQAVYLQQLHDSGDRTWALVSGNIVPATPDPAEALRQQGQVYTLETVSPSGQRNYQPIRSIGRAFPYREGLQELLEVGADPDTRIVSFTVTEAGYGPLIYGVLARILQARMDQGSGPVTLLCCDNLRHNGDQVRQGLRASLAGRGDLSAWVEANTSFPNSMVDRITPRATPELAERVRRATGFDDKAAVMSETWLQWVMEDDFCNGRPAWESVGVQMVASVAPYEEAKIRILNGSHSCLAWAGRLAGHHTIDQCMADPRIRALVHAYVTDCVFDCLRPTPVDLEAYRDQVFERFSSDAIRDTVERVLADSAAKLEGFIMPTIRDRARLGLPQGVVAVLPALYQHVAQLDRLQATATEMLASALSSARSST